MDSNPLGRADPYGLFDVGGNHIDIGDIHGYSFRLDFYDTWLKQFGRDYGRSGIKWIDRLAKVLGLLSSKTGVSDLPKSKRGSCDKFDPKARDIFEKMFGSEDASVNSEQLLKFLRRLERTPDYPRGLYPPAQDFVRRAEEHAHMSPRDMIRDLAK